MNYEGKVVAKFSYRKNDQNLQVPVRLIQEKQEVESTTAPNRGKGSKPMNTNACHFAVFLREIGLSKDHRDKIESTDIELVRVQVMGLLDKKHEIQWEEWFLVEVQESSLYGHQDGAAFELTWNTVYVHTMEDGRKIHMFDSRYSGRVMKGLPDLEPRRRDSTRSLILATEENEKGLAAIADKIKATKALLQKFLSQKNIMKNLANVAGMLLPEPKEKPDV